MTLEYLHSGQMLNCTGNANGDIKVRCHHLARLPDLPVIWREARVHGGSRRTNAGAELVRQRLDILVKFALLRMPRPPETMILAEANSGRLFLATRSLTKLDSPGSATATMVSTGALPPSPTAEKVDVRTVITFLASLDLTV